MDLYCFWYWQLLELAYVTGHKMEQEGQFPYELRLPEEDGTLIETTEVVEHVVKKSSHQGIVHSLAIQVEASRRRNDSPDDGHHLLPSNLVRFTPLSAQVVLFAGNLR